MTSSSPPASSSSASHTHEDPRAAFTFNLVNWDALASLGRELYHADSSTWGEQIHGGYNLVRFLHLHDSNETILVARVPLRSQETMSTAHNFSLSKRVASEVATMEYVKRFTTIPVPEILHHSAEANGPVGLPYVLMTKIEGIALVRVWDDMEDEKRRIILQQVIDILLQLWSHRFDKKGALFRREDGIEEDDWYIESSALFEDPDNTGSRHYLPTTSYTHAANYWLAYANAFLRDIYDTEFGQVNKVYDYAIQWFMRSIIPALFDPASDAHGLPLCPGDFHSQNILVTDLETSPRITGIIDWEFSGPDFVTAFAQYPLFIVDHPAWEDDHPLRKRNVQDQATFDGLLREAERHHNSAGLPLSHYISQSYPIYLFQQIMYHPITASALYDPLFKYVFGEDEDFRGSYYYALMQGILRKHEEHFDKQREVWLEAREVLGEDLISADLTKAQFKKLVSNRINEFGDSEGKVCRWLASIHTV